MLFYSGTGRLLVHHSSPCQPLWLELDHRPSLAPRRRDLPVVAPLYLGGYLDIHQRQRRLLGQLRQ